MRDVGTTRLLKLGMETNRERIPEAWRCPQCDGRGQQRTGCAIFYATYAMCFDCFGAGKKQRWDWLWELLDAMTLEGEFQEYLRTSEYPRDNRPGRSSFLIFRKNRL